MSSAPQVELALATIRGLALLRVAGQSERSLARQWRYMRGEVVALLAQQGIERKASG